MAFMWRGVTSVSEMIWPYRQHFKYLLVVPFLVALAVASYKIGHSSSSELTRHGLEDAVLHRERRDVTEAPVQQVNNMKQGTSGVTYTRWGRKECPDGVDTVYSGVTGGSLYNSHGGGANPLCLPMEPLWGTYNEAVEKGSQLYGAEFESPSAFDFKNFPLNNAQDHNIPCVVCHSTRKSSILMIPARNLCYGDWRMEYSGYLMSGNSAHPGRSQFICMDGTPESYTSGFRDENGALFYNVEGVCGALPCPPYVVRREITCVVCSK